MQASAIILGVAIVFEVMATSALTASNGFTRLWPSVAAAIGYTASLYLLSLALRTISVGVAYAIWSGLGIVLIAAIGWLAFGQKLDWQALLGMALIISGVMVMNLFSQTTGH